MALENRELLIPVNIRLRTRPPSITEEAGMSAGLAAALDLVDEGIAWREKLERDNDGGT